MMMIVNCELVRVLSSAGLITVDLISEVLSYWRDHLEVLP
jgi:hypothetical protein